MMRMMWLVVLFACEAALSATNVAVYASAHHAVNLGVAVFFAFMCVLVLVGIAKTS
jgi:hypothetical protein